MRFFFILGALRLPGIPGFIEDGTALLYAVEVADIILLIRGAWRLQEYPGLLVQLLLRRDSDPWPSEREVEEPGSTALQRVLLPSVGKQRSKAGIFLVQRNCI